MKKIKKVLSLVLLAAVAVSMLSVYAFATEVTPRNFASVYEVTGDAVNLRSGPGTTYPSYGLLYKGDRFIKHDHLTQYAYWYQGSVPSRFQGVYGYVYYTYLSYVSRVL